MPARSNQSSRCLPRCLSLKQRRAIEDVVQRGRTLRGAAATFRWQPADRFGYVVVVGRRHGHAARRNRIKRLLREALRLNRHRLTREVRIAVLPRLYGDALRFDILHAEFGRIFEAINRHAD